MKISFFIGGLIGGGAERVTCNLSNYLISKGYNVQILTMSETESYPLSETVERRSLLKNEKRGNIISNYVRRYKSLKKILKEDDSDCYVVMLPVTTIFLLMLKKYAKAPIIASERCYPAVLSEITQRLLLLLAYRANAWVFQTRQQRDWYGKSVSNSIVKIIPNSVNTDFIKDPYKGERNNQIVAVGRLCPQKNYEMLIHAFSKVSVKFPVYSLAIFGEGIKRGELENLVDELNLRNKVKMPGYDKNISSQLRESPLYVLSSNYEGIPNTLMEAMALGVPSIATDCDGGGSAMLIDNEKNGLLVPKGDVDALAKAMERMLSDRVFAEKCGREAHKICNRLGPEKIYREWEQFIKEVANN